MDSYYCMHHSGVFEVVTAADNIFVSLRSKLEFDAQVIVERCVRNTRWPGGRDNSRVHSGLLN